MATSGVVSTTIIQVKDYIDHAALRCGVEPSKLTAQQLEFARRNLYYYLSSLSNVGLDLWTITRVQIGMVPNQIMYKLPIGAINVLNLMYRVLTNWSGPASSSAGGTPNNCFDGDPDTVCTQVTPNGNISVDFGGANPTIVQNVGFMSNGNNNYTLAWEYSSDNINWTVALLTPLMAYVDKVWTYFEIPTPASAEFFRVRETGGGTLNIRELVFGTNPTDIPITKLNRDDYATIPFKRQTATYPTQYWFNRIIPQPELWVWPVPNNINVSIVGWYHRYIQDVVAFTDEIEVPQRWYENILTNLAARMALEIPKVDPQRRKELGAMAAATEYSTTSEERDNSPIFMTPQIGAYTK